MTSISVTIRKLAAQQCGTVHPRARKAKVKSKVTTTKYLIVAREISKKSTSSLKSNKIGNDQMVMSCFEKQTSMLDQRDERGSHGEERKDES